MFTLTHLKLRTQLFLVIVVVVSAIFAITILIIGINSTHAAKASALRDMEQITQNNGQLIASQLGMVMNTARTVARQFEIYASLPTEQRRPYFSEQIRYVLEKNPRFVGVWTCWEPNALDGMDAHFAHRDGSDASGRFIPYWNRASGKIIMEPLVNYEQTGVGDYYLLAKKSGQEQILSPFKYTAGGKEVLMTSIVVPIKDAQGVVLGAVGIDIDLLNVQEDVTRIKTHKSGGAFLLGNDASFASYPHSNAIGQSFNTVSPGLDQKYAITKAVAQGERLSFDDISPISGQPAFFVFNPVRIGSTTTPWSLALFVPVAEVMEPVRNNVMWLIVIGIIGIAITGTVVFWFAQSLSRPIEKGAEYAAVIAGGDLTQQIDERYCQRGDEVGTLVSALSQMQQQLTEVISQVQSIAAGVHMGANEIVAGNRDLSARTEAQAASLEQTAASMEQLTATVRHNVENAGMANRLADEAQTQAEQGKTVVSSVFAAMTAINHSNSKINDIVEVIDTFAFQTNLLALNAAVEAARAGEQGRGFAIVAGEVRQLAQRSAAAAKEIRVLVADSTHKVHDGGQLAESAGQALQQIVSSVKKVGGIVAEMATASREQASGIEQVNKAVLQLDQAVQQNASLVEEIASSGDAFNEQVANLRSVVDFFNVRSAAHTHPSS